MALTFKEVRRLFQVPTSGRVRLGDYDPGWAAHKQFKDLTKDELKARASEFLQRNIADLADAQERLYASDTHSVLIVLQASDRQGRHDQARNVWREPRRGARSLPSRSPRAKSAITTFCGGT